MVPDGPHKACDETVEAMLDAVGRQRLSDAAAVLEGPLRANPCWLRGYLLLATIYEHGAHLSEAMAVIERGLGACVDGIRLLSSPRWIHIVERLNGPFVPRRIRRNHERFKHYEQMFRHRRASLEVRGCRIGGESADSIDRMFRMECEHDA
jgi:hypothetical protein